MSKQAEPTANGFTPGANCYVRETVPLGGGFFRRELMVEVKPGVFVNEITARLQHGVMPKKADKGGHHGPTQKA